MTGALDAVIDAALERALLCPTGAQRYFALAGALARARPPQAPDETPRSRPSSERDDPSQVTTGSPDDVLGAALVSTVAVRALESAEDPVIDPDAWVPGGGKRTGDLIAAGAAAACRRLDVDPERVAAESGVPRERLRRLRFGE